MSPLQQLLDRVRRHLMRERLAAAGRRAAWGSAGVAALGVLLHFLVRPVDPTGLLAALGLPWLLALLQVITTRARPAECAAWADRHLEGRSAYSTCLELTATSRDDAGPAIAHLESWLAASTPGRLARLAARPFDARMRKPVAAALVCSALAIALLQLPARPLAATHDAPQAMGHRAATAAGERPAGERGDAAARSPGTGLGDARNASQATLEQQQRAASAQDASAGEDVDATDAGTSSTPEGAAGVQATVRTAATGREAGDSPDADAGTALTAPWQGELTARLRQVTGTRERDALRADATLAAEYEQRSVARSTADADALSAAAAAPPPARPVLRLGPAEQAYLRAYFADSGASP